MSLLVSVNVSPGGMPKLPVLFANVTPHGLTGDSQRDRRYHGGPDRAVCIFSVELYDALRKDGVDLVPGSVGENFTTQGIDLLSLKIGDRLQVGSCTIELTNIRIPCGKLNQWHPQLLKLIQGRSGWVAKVIVSAEVRPGDPITLGADKPLTRNTGFQPVPETR